MKNLLLIFSLLTLFGQARSFAQCNPDVTPPVAVCVSDLSRDVSTNAAGFITLNAADFNAGSFDACDPSNTLNYFIEVAPQSATPPSTTSLNFNQADAGDQTIILWVVDAAGNAATCESTLHLSICENNVLSCSSEVTVQLAANGQYNLDAFDILESGSYCDYNTYQIALDQPSGFTPGNTLTINDIGSHQVYVSGVGALCSGILIVEPGSSLNTYCPQLFVDIATPSVLSPCANGSYSIMYTNASTIPVANSYVDVELSYWQQYIQSSIPGNILSGRVVRFPTGDLAPGQSGTFTMDFTIACNAPTGATHCSKARIYPRTICTPGTLQWSGAEITVEGTCGNDGIELKIRNIGDENSQVLDYVVVEDVLMLTQGSFSIAANDSLSLPPLPATGATYRLEAQQDPSFPYGGRPAIAVEGCGGLTPGMVTLFPLEDSDPAISVSCVESYIFLVANDQNAWPVGYDDEHFIEKSTALEYLLRFDNAASTAVNQVVILDTLSEFLDPQSIRLGASSHPYTFDLLKGNILRITFDNVKLLSNSADEEVHGFVKFSIKQKTNNPVGSRIENTASIYVDYNAPVQTSSTFHTVGEKFLATVNTGEAAVQGLADMKVFPNPGIGRMYFEPAIPVAETVSFVLNDMLGCQVRQLNEVNFPMAFERNGLDNGTYFFRFTGRDGKTMWSGKIIMK